MDDLRKIIISICRQLIKVQARINQLYWTPKKYPNGQWQVPPTWQVGELNPPSPWFEGCPPNTALSGAGAAVSLVMTHLMAMVTADGPIDPKEVCIVLQHLTLEGMGSGWGGPVVRLAGRLGLVLPHNPREWHHGLSLDQRPITKLA